MRMFGAAAEIASSFLMEGKHSFYGVVEWLRVMYGLGPGSFCR